MPAEDDVQALAEIAPAKDHLALLTMSDTQCPHNLGNIVERHGTEVRDLPEQLELSLYIHVGPRSSPYITAPAALWRPSKCDLSR
jgi:hypothetical protein